MKDFLNFTIREAMPYDSEPIFNLVCELAKYENLSHLVACTATDYERAIKNRECYALVAEVEEKIVAYAIYFYSFSTFNCGNGIYLEDLYVKTENRGSKIGKSMIEYLVEICKKNGFKRLEWACLDWNKLSIDFYLRLGAKQLAEWTTYRLDVK